jgi:hypothetical protein
LWAAGDRYKVSVGDPRHGAGEQYRTVRKDLNQMKRAVVGTLLGVGLAIMVGAPVTLSAQEPEFVFSGVWVGDFKDKTEPERDLATTGVRERAITGDGKSECEGGFKLTFSGANNHLSATGELLQTCKEMRAGTWQLPPEAIGVSDFEFKDKGEGKDKELKFRLEIRTRISPTASSGTTSSSDSGLARGNELMRCDAKGKYKPKDRVFKGTYSCRHEFRQRTSGQRNTAIQIRGKFELTRGGAGTDS